MLATMLGSNAFCMKRSKQLCKRVQEALQNEKRSLKLLVRQNKNKIEALHIRIEKKMKPFIKIATDFQNPKTKMSETTQMEYRKRVEKMVDESLEIEEKIKKGMTELATNINLIWEIKEKLQQGPKKTFREVKQEITHLQEASKRISEIRAGFRDHYEKREHMMDLLTAPLGPNPLEDVNVCKVCKQPPKKGCNFQVCSRCQTAYYCSTKCQKMDWTNHKKVCNK